MVRSASSLAEGLGSLTACDEMGSTSSNEARPSGPPVSTWRLAVAALASAAVVASAPFMGQMRAVLRSAFPAQFVAIVGAAVAGAIALAMFAAVRSIRHRRVARYSAIAAAFILGLVYGAAFRTGIPEVDVVERVHFVEYGLLTFLFYRAWRSIGDPTIIILPLLAGVLVGSVEEWFQWFIPNRVGEARDVLLNLAAVACGLLFSFGVDPPESFSRRLHPGSATRIGVLAIIVVLTFAMFAHSVHLGYSVGHPDLGSFKSRYRDQELTSLSADRAARWRQSPPTVLRRLSREDQYMDEGLWHVQRRNEAWATGDHDSAWSENRILEEFFAPVLDAPSYVSATGHRWPSAQRAEAAARGANRARPYVSDAEPHPILTWSKPLFWSAVGMLCALIGLSVRRFDRRRR